MKSGLRFQKNIRAEGKKEKVRKTGTGKKTQTKKLERKERQTSERGGEKLKQQQKKNTKKRETSPLDDELFSNKRTQERTHASENERKTIKPKRKHRQNENESDGRKGIMTECERSTVGER